MGDLISRKDAIDALVKRTGFAWETLKIFQPMLCVLEELPTIDAVPIVRCKDCMNSSAPETFSVKCELRGDYMFTNDYCSYGVRRKENR